MTSTTKRGFHLPWSGDARAPGPSAPAKPAPGSKAAAASASRSSATPASEATAAAPATTSPLRAGLRRHADDELGRGPFGLAPSAEASDESAVATADRSGDSLVDNDEVLKRMPDRGVPKEAATAVDSPTMAWPDVDRAGSETHLASDAALPPVRPPVVVEGAEESASAPSSRNTALKAGLVKAMRDAARATRAESMARMRAEAAARTEEIRLAGTAGVLALRKLADEDLVTIRDWSKAEMARVKDEAEQRVAGRRAQLARETQSHASDVERLVETVKSVASTFEADMERFFEVLLAEDDPARLATLAEQVPDAPVFPNLAIPTRATSTRATNAPKPRSASPKASARKPAPKAHPSAVPATEMTAEAAFDARLAPDAAAAAEAEAIADLDPSDDLADGGAAAWSSENLASVLATAPKIHSRDDLSPEEIAGLLGVEASAAPEPVEADAVDAFPLDALVPERLEPEAAATTPAESATPDDLTRVVVSGLTSVAGISAFKGSLARVPGVVSVSVSSGADDDFVFAVVHGDATDLRRAVADFPGFSAQMTLDEGTEVSFTVSEPS